MEKRYTNGETTVIWKPEICIHSGICARGLPQVFDPKRKPWIEMQHSDTARIEQQVAACPSGALSILAKSDV